MSPSHVCVVYVWRIGQALFTSSTRPLPPLLLSSYYALLPALAVGCSLDRPPPPPAADFVNRAQNGNRRPSRTPRPSILPLPPCPSSTTRRTTPLSPARPIGGGNSTGRTVPSLQLWWRQRPELVCASARRRAAKVRRYWSTLLKHVTNIVLHSQRFCVCPPPLSLWYGDTHCQRRRRSKCSVGTNPR